MAFLMAGMAVASMVQANSQKNKAMKAAAADIELQRAKMERARLRAAGDLATNTQRAREASQKREIEIERNRVKAESKVDETFAGSGISGTSVDELDNELNAEVSQNKVDNKKALDQNLSDQFRGARQGAEDDFAQSSQIGAGAPKGSSFIDQAIAGAQGAAQGAEFQGTFDKAASGIQSFFTSTPTSTMGLGNPTRANGPRIMKP